MSIDLVLFCCDAGLGFGGFAVLAAVLTGSRPCSTALTSSGVPWVEDDPGGLHAAFRDVQRRGRSRLRHARVGIRKFAHLIVRRSDLLCAFECRLMLPPASVASRVAIRARNVSTTLRQPSVEFKLGFLEFSSVDRAALRPGRRQSLFRPKVLIREHRLLGVLDDDRSLQRGLMAGVAGLGQMVIGLGKLGLILVLYGHVHLE
jgi:hypothetical protein